MQKRMVIIMFLSLSVLVIMVAVASAQDDTYIPFWSGNETVQSSNIKVGVEEIDLLLVPTPDPERYPAKVFTDEERREIEREVEENAETISDVFRESIYVRGQDVSLPEGAAVEHFIASVYCSTPSPLCITQPYYVIGIGDDKIVVTATSGTIHPYTYASGEPIDADSFESRIREQYSEFDKLTISREFIHAYNAYLDDVAKGLDPMERYK